MVFDFFFFFFLVGLMAVVVVVTGCVGGCDCVGLGCNRRLWLWLCWHMEVVAG